MPFNHLLLCHPLLLLPSIFPTIRIFSNESVLHIRWSKSWSFSFSISPSNKYSGLISFRMEWLDLLVVQGLSRVFLNTTVQKHQFFSAHLFSGPALTSIHDYWRNRAVEVLPGVVAACLRLFTPQPEAQADPQPRPTCRATGGDPECVSGSTGDSTARSG